jgi:hypothetical protein
MLCRLGKILCGVSLTVALLASGSGANALCIYSGKHFTKAKDSDGSLRGLYATTTLTDEFQDSTLVVKGTVLSSRNIGLDANGTIYRIRIEQIFKGRAPAVITDYTDRDSGGFYLEEGGEGPEYLLFLNPISRTRKPSPGAYEINYSCGQSRPWANAFLKDREKLTGLSETGR